MREAFVPVHVPAGGGGAGASAPARRAQAGTDRLLFSALVTLMLAGVLVVYTSSSAVSLDRFGTPHHHALRHLGHLALGAVAFVLAWRIDVRRLDRPAVVHGLWALTVVLLVLTLFEEPAGGARRWLRLAGFSFQPSELAKLAVVLACAFQLSRRLDRLHDAWKGIVPPLLVAGQVVLLVAIQPDFGTAASLLLLVVLLAFVAGTPLRLLLAMGLACATVLGLYLIQEPYRLERLRAFADPSADPLGANFQLRQSLIALGTGGFFGRSGEGLLGTGLGCSIQKLYFLPEPHTDFTFAILGEELGLVGTLAVLLLFLVVLVRGFRVAASAGDAFGTLVATGCTAILALQALLNMAVVTGLLPTKGLPLPFLSAGGSSLLASCTAGGLLLSVSRDG